MNQIYLLIVTISAVCMLKFVASVTVQVRIFGGEQSTNPILYQISLQKFRQKKWNHFCGGSIVSQHHVITAAHCVHQELVRQLSILVGTTRRSSNSTRHPIEYYTVHPSYRPNNYHDIALIKIRTKFEFDLNVAPIFYNQKNYVPSGVKCRVSGWGVMERIRTAPFPEDLQTADLLTVSNRFCYQYYNISRNELCAVGRRDEGTCAGDSGGPLVTWDRSQLLGVVSHGSTYCGMGIPDVYTRISAYASWIEAVIKRGSNG